MSILKLSPNLPIMISEEHIRDVFDQRLQIGIKLGEEQHRDDLRRQMGAEIVNRHPGYAPLVLKGVHSDLPPTYDLYIEGSGRCVLYRAATYPFTIADRDRLMSVGVPNLWIRIPTADDNHPQRQLAAVLSLSDEAVPPLAKAGLVYNSAMAISKRVFDNFASEEALTDLDELLAEIVGYMMCNRTAFQALLLVMAHDFLTYTHTVNVAIYALGLGRFLGIKDRDEMRNLGLGAILHDVGKTRVPEKVLNKQGPLSSDEWAIMRRHPTWGAELISSSNLPKEVLSIVEQHHEGLDGSGYPLGITDKEIHPSSKVVALADTYDALTSKRPYRSASSPYDALMFIKKEMMRKLDSEVFTGMVRLLGCPSQVAVA